ERFYEIFDENSGFGLGQREYFWGVTIAEIGKNFFGYGHNYIYEKIGYTTHNDYLGQVVSVGLFPAILFFMFIIRYLLKNMKTMNSGYRENIYWNKVSFYMILTYLIISFTEQVSYANKMWITLLFFIIGISNHTLISNKLKNK